MDVIEEGRFLFFLLTQGIEVLVLAVLCAILGVLLAETRRRSRVLTARVGALEERLASDTPSSQPASAPPAVARGHALAPVGVVILLFVILFFDSFFLVDEAVLTVAREILASPLSRGILSWALVVAAIVLGLSLAEARRRARLLTARVGALDPTAGMEGTSFQSRPRSHPVWPAWAPALRSFLFGGNTLVRLGAVILFFGFAFFLGYAADQGWLPVELRLSAAVAAGIALLAIGWRVRDLRREFGLALQGCGAGIVYLTVFAAVNFDVIAAGVGLRVMLVLVAVTGVLAARQDAPSLAVLASLGGFLGPVLVTRDASHVALFSYYAVLDAGIAAMAWFRAWGALNLLGFVFTFLVGAWWGAAFYQPLHFATTQPFLALFFALFVAVPVLHAWRRPPRPAGFVDGILVFGVPLAAYTLQHRLASGFEYGPALSALAFCVFYAVVAGLIAGRGRESLRPLVESFVALSAVFGTLVVPLAVDGSWTAAAWALEGAALVWIGARWNRRLVLLSGLGLQFLAGCMAVVGQSSGALPVLDLGHPLVGLSGLVSAWCLRRPGVLNLDSRLVSAVALTWGAAWWFGAGVNEISRHLSGLDQDSATLGFLSISAAAFALMRSRLPWNDLAYPPLLLLPAMVLLTADWLLTTPDVLAGWGVLAWPSAFLFQYWVLRRCESDWSAAAPWYHCGTLWLGVFLVWREAVWVGGQITPDGTTWSVAVGALVPTYFLWAPMTFRTLLPWPVERFREIYLGIGQLPLVLAAAGWVLAASFHPGDPYPLPYVPLLNPVEFVQVFSLGVLLQWSLADAGRRSIAARCLFGFVVLNGVLARTTHHLFDVPFEADALLSSDVFHTLLSVAWTTTALVVMVAATRTRRRPAWWVGAALLTVTVIKLFLFDLADTGTLTRIVSFMVVGGLILVLGYVSPLPPEDAEASD